MSYKNSYGLSQHPSAGRTGGSGGGIVGFLSVWGACIILLLILDFLGRLFIAPFKTLVMSDSARLKEKIQSSKKKIEEREKYRLEVQNDPQDPLNQYYLRFKSNENEYQNDPDNGYYKEWFEDFKNGIMQDVQLKWAPAVYIIQEGKAVVNRAFLDYLSNQVELNRSRHNVTFLWTIRNRYPEFSPRYSNIPGEIEELRERSKYVELQKELVSEIISKGVSEEIAKAMVQMNLNAEQLKKAIPFALKCAEKEWGIEFFLFCVGEGLDPDTWEDKYAEVLNLSLKITGSAQIARSILNRELSASNWFHIMCSCDDKAEDPEEYRKALVEGYKSFMKEKFLSQVGG